MQVFLSDMQLADFSVCLVFFFEEQFLIYQTVKIVDCAFGVMSEESLLNPRSQGFFNYVSSRSFID